jgi:hypothetical protein
MKEVKRKGGRYGDAGASPTTSERGASANAFWHMMNCLKCFEV